MDKKIPSVHGCEIDPFVGFFFSFPVTSETLSCVPPELPLSARFETIDL